MPDNTLDRTRVVHHEQVIDPPAASRRLACPTTDAPEEGCPRVIIGRSPITMMHSAVSVPNSFSAWTVKVLAPSLGRRPRMVLVAGLSDNPSGKRTRDDGERHGSAPSAATVNTLNRRPRRSAHPR